MCANKCINCNVVHTDIKAQSYNSLRLCNRLTLWHTTWDHWQWW